MRINTPEKLLLALEILEANLPTYQAQVGTTAADLTAVSEDRANLETALSNDNLIEEDKKTSTAIKNALYDGEPSVKVAIYPTFGIQPLPFPANMNGCLTRYSDLKARIKSAKGYTREIGMALGFEEVEGGGESPDSMIGATTLKDLGNYQYEATFKKKGASAMLFQQRLRGTEKWFDAKTALNSPIVITVDAPAVEGAAVQLEVRCRPLKGNEQIGQWSPIYSITVSP